MTILPRILLVAVLALACHLPAVRGESLTYGQGLLWKVEKGGAASHVFGTVHSVDERILRLPAPVADVFEAASSLTLELVSDAAAELRAQRVMLLADGRTLKDLIGPEDFAAVVELGERYELPAAMLQLLKPWALVGFFSYPPSEFARLRAGEAALDARLEQVAAIRGVPVHGLETQEEQVEAFDGMPEADQVALLRGLLAESAQIETLHAELLQNYLSRDVAAIHAMMLDTVSEGEEHLLQVLEQRLVIERNHRMVDRMHERLAGGGAFVAVGALHLPGEDGILRLLERRGFAISRVY